MLRYLVVTISFFVLSSSPLQGQLAEKWGVPSSPTDEAVAAVLEMIDRGEDRFTRSMLEERFDPSFLVERLPEVRLQFSRDPDGSVGALRIRNRGGSWEEAPRSGS